MSTRANSVRRLIRVSAVADASLGGFLAFGTAPALASYTAQVENGTLQITGNQDSDKLALRLAPGDPNTLQVDVGDDGTTDFSFDRSTFTAINVDARGGRDRVTVAPEVSQLINPVVDLGADQ
jgi:hypothetical protein